MSRILSPLLIGLLVGVLAGGVGGWTAAQRYRDVVSDTAGPPRSLGSSSAALEPRESAGARETASRSECEPELNALRARIALLEKEQPSESSREKLPERELERPADPTPRLDAAKWRISAIEKFVPLTEEQRARLSTKFDTEARGGDEAESLEDILGTENARFYREQVSAAFKKVKEEETDREVVWLSRQLNLTPEQEGGVRAVFASVEQELSAEAAARGAEPGSPQDRVRSMVEENRRRSQLRAERLRGVLTDDQYEAFARVEAESSSADLEVFHDPAS